MSQFGPLEIGEIRGPSAYAFLHGEELQPLPFIEGPPLDTHTGTLLKGCSDDRIWMRNPDGSLLELPTSRWFMGEPLAKLSKQLLATPTPTFRFLRYGDLPNLNN